MPKKRGINWYSTILQVTFICHMLFFTSVILTLPSRPLSLDKNPPLFFTATSKVLLCRSDNETLKSKLRREKCFRQNIIKVVWNQKICSFRIWPWKSPRFLRLQLLNSYLLHKEHFPLQNYLYSTVSMLILISILPQGTTPNSTLLN